MSPGGPVDWEGLEKADGKLGRCFFTGTLGDALNVILCAAGQKLHKLLHWLLCAWIGIRLFQPIGYR